MCVTLVHNHDGAVATQCLDDSSFLWMFSRTFLLFFSATPLLAHTPYDLFDQIWRNGAHFDTLVQTFSTFSFQPLKFKILHCKMRFFVKIHPFSTVTAPQKLYIEYQTLGLLIQWSFSPKNKPIIKSHPEYKVVTTPTCSTTKFTVPILLFSICESIKLVYKLCFFTLILIIGKIWHPAPVIVDHYFWLTWIPAKLLWEFLTCTNLIAFSQ